MKRLILLGSLVMLLTPLIASAHGDNNNGRRHRHIGATEFASVGFAAAAMIGVAGYFSLRRRNAN